MFMDALSLSERVIMFRCSNSITNVAASLPWVPLYLPEVPVVSLISYLMYCLISAPLSCGAIGSWSIYRCFVVQDERREGGRENPITVTLSISEGFRRKRQPSCCYLLLNDQNRNTLKVYLYPSFTWIIEIRNKLTHSWRQQLVFRKKNETEMQENKKNTTHSRLNLSVWMHVNGLLWKYKAHYLYTEKHKKWCSHKHKSG